MIIQCGKDRRLRSHRYGWIIEIRKQNEKTGEWRFAEDSPGHPSTLAQALTMVQERVLKEMGDCDVGDLPERLKHAHRALLEYTEKARRAA